MKYEIVIAQQNRFDVVDTKDDLDAARIALNWIIKDLQLTKQKVIMPVLAVDDMYEFYTRFGDQLAYAGILSIREVPAE